MFVMAESLPAVSARLRQENVEIEEAPRPAGSPEDARRVAALARRQGTDWVVVDGYHFNSAYQEELKRYGLRVLLIDDYGHASRYVADLVLNQNISADESLYRNRNPTTELLLGPRYALLRREFARWRDWNREIPPWGDRILITFGGVDTFNVSLTAVHALSRLDVQAVVVVGGGNPHVSDLEEAVRASGGRVRLERDVQAISDLMAWADIAVASAGTTSWELAFMGLPFVAVVLAKNQEAIAEGLDRMGVAINIGWHTSLEAETLSETLTRLIEDAPTRRRMSNRGRSLVDGRGTERVIARLLAGVA